MMSDQLKILFLPHYTGPEMTRPWQKDLEAAIDERPSAVETLPDLG